MTDSTTNTVNGARGFRMPGFGRMLEVSFLLVASALLLFAPNRPSIQTLSLIFTSIVLEAFPFMLFGAMVGGLLEVFVSRERMTALMPKKRPWLTVFIAAGMGCVFPVCECAVVPVVRRLAKKGLPTGAAVAYLLGGPIVNPIVAASTALAYAFDYRVVVLRLGLGYLIAVFIGLCMNRFFSSRGALLADLRHERTDACQCGTPHTPMPLMPINASNTNGPLRIEAPPADHETEDGSACACGHCHNATGLREKWVAACRHAADDFLAVGHFLVIGAFIAAVAQTYIDRKLFLDFAGHMALPSMLMMALAILLNLCSEADAFIAASFRGLMPLPAQMAFLLTGPMFDLKLLLMYQSLFRKRAIMVLATLILLTVLGVSLCLTLSMPLILA